MECTVCNRDVKDGARVCRFCGAYRDGVGWHPVAQWRRSRVRRNFAVVGVVVLVGLAVVIGYERSTGVSERDRSFVKCIQRGNPEEFCKRQP